MWGCDKIVSMNTQETQMEMIYKWGKIVLIILAVFLGVKTLDGLKDLRELNPAYNSITVSGEGEVVVVPDLATFSFTVSADADQVSEAQSAVTSKMDTILASLKDMGIEEKDIKTTDYSVYPKYSYQEIYCITTPCPGGRQVQDGYTASHHVSVKIRKTEDAGKALALAGEKGATNLSQLSFTTDDPQQALNDARKEAIEDAREKAEELARELNVSLVRVVSFNDNTGPSYFYAGAMDSRAESAVALKAPTLPMGENKMKVEVSVTYEIR